MRLTRIAGLLLLVSVALASTPGDPPRPPEKDAAKQVPALVKQLGDDDYHKREAAAKLLQEIGEPALPDLRGAAASPDPEVRERARGLVLAILRAAGRSKSTGMELHPVLS